MLKKLVVRPQTVSSHPVSTARTESSSIASMIRNSGAMALALLLVASATLAFAEPAKTTFVPFDKFIENTRTANSADLISRAESKVKDAAAFEEMRQSILNRYQGVTVTHSFVLGNQHYDCVSVDQQPAVRNYHLSAIAPAPPQELAAKAVTSEGNVKPAEMYDPKNPFDEFGNSVRCEANTVPLLRTTLETLSRFPTLADFYRKAPGGAVKAAQNADPKFVDPAVSTHKYSFTYQYVNNWGGNSNLNVWDPYVNTSESETFSLSQEWYVGGSGSATQTEEVGWVVYPGMFGDENPHFFIFSTPNDYSSGCWDNTCGDFVQVADSGLLGASLSPVSTAGDGTQYEISAEYYFYEGNWWLAEQGTWIGYYPGSMYSGGQNTKYAQIIEFGTEGVGTTIWPPEGSGYWSYDGWSYAAYQRNLWYINDSSTYASYWDSLTADDPSPACYSISGPYSSSSSGWTVYFYEGGPGGTGC